MKRPWRIIVMVLLAGAGLQALLWSRQWIYGDQYALLLAGLDFTASGRLAPFAKTMSGDGRIPGSLLQLLVGVPLQVWADYRAPAVLIGVFHVAAAAVLVWTIARGLGAGFLAAYLCVYWLSPWRLYHAGFLWEPAYVFLPAALHLACAYHLRDRPLRGWSLVLAATLVLSVQLHASFVVLLLLTAALTVRKLVRIDWVGAAMGAILGGLTFIPTVMALRAGTLPGFMPGATEDSPRVVIGALNVLKGLSYWFRQGSLDIGRRLRQAVDGDAALGVILIGASAASVILAVLASWRYFRPAAPIPAGEHVPEPASHWFRAYAWWCLVAMGAAAALSPVPLQGWHVVIAFHAACLPVAAWLHAALQGSSRLARATAIGFVALEVTIVLALAFGHPMYRPLSGDTLRDQDLPEAVRRLIPDRP